MEDLFERIKALFNKKRDPRLGIRLFGIALQNLEREDSPRQQELFDFGDEKKRRLESAILKAQEKDPSLKITSARLLGKKLFTVIFSALCFYALAPKAQAQVTLEKADGASSIVFDTSKLPLSNSGNFTSLFNRDFGNQNVEFFARGYWKSSLKGEASYSFGFGSDRALSTPAPVFVQNVDLDLYFMLNHHWYFEAAFADEFNKNTVAAGYVGQGYLKSAKISNRNIIFPSTYSISDLNRGIGGGENQAPGISLNWAGQKWKADAVFRYDMLAAHEKTWYGKNSLSINEISLSDYNSGNQYFLPGENLIQNIKDVYVESAGGSYRDSRGRKYKKLDSSQYLLLSSRKQLLLSRDAKAYRQNGILPAVIITFNISVSQSDFGSYSDSGSFLGKVQAWFNRSFSSVKIDLKKYAAPLFTSINGEDSLYLQYPSGFSPFVVANRYDCGSSSASDAQIASASTGSGSKSYTAVINEDDLKFAQKDFFNSSHLYADISMAENPSSDEITALIQENFPLAGEHPQFYLGLKANEDLVLQVRTFTSVKRFEIGPKAVEGMVTIYKNGIIDSAASYDSQSGTITLSSAVSSSDHIVARWYEDSEDSKSGSFTGAAGFCYDFTEKLSGDISTSTRWSYSKDREYADSNYSSQGYASLAGKIAWKDENLNAKNIMGFTYENDNITGLYRILGNDDSESSTFYLSKKAGLNLPDDFAPVLNERDSSGSVTSTSLSPAKKASVEKSDGISDSSISGYAQPFEWNFSAIEASSSSRAWSALTINTSGMSGILSNASEFLIKIKNPVEITADSEIIPTWKISDSSAWGIKSAFDFSKSGWQNVSVILSDQDRSTIASLNAYSARLILVTEDTSALPKSGCLYSGPYAAGRITFSTQCDENLTSTNYQTTDSSLSSSKVSSLNKLSSHSNYVQYFDWKFNDDPNQLLSDECDITFSRYIDQTDYSPYKKLSFFLKMTSSDSGAKVKIILDRKKSSGAIEKAVTYTIENPSAQWEQYTIDLAQQNTDVIPSRLQIIVTTKGAGSLSFDELYLEGNSPYVTLQDKAESSWKKDGIIIQQGDFDILKDFKVSLDGNAATSIKTEDGKNRDSSLSGSGKVNFTLANIKVTGNAKISNAYLKSQSSDINQKNPLASGGHSLESEKEVLKVLSFVEKFNYSAEDQSLEKENSAKIDFSKVILPLEIEAETKASSDSWSLKQNSALKSSLQAGKLKIKGESSVSQQLLTSLASTSSGKGKEKFNTEYYFTSWKDISSFAFDSGDEKSAKRSVKGQASISCSFEKARLTPKITFTSQGNYKSSSKITYNDSSSFNFELPFSLAKNNFSLSWKKSAGSSFLTEAGGAYQRDFWDLCSSLEKKSYFFYAFPIYDLVSENLSSRIYDTSLESNYFNGAYAFNWKRAFFANRYDFFIPISAKLEATRDIRSADSTSDFYQIKQTVNNNALNIFGRRGSLPIFNFFANDEYNSSLTAGFKIPRNEAYDFSFLISGYFQATFYFTSSTYLKQGFEASLEGSENWKLKYTAVWKRQASSSLIKGVISIFKNPDDLQDLKITKSDSFNAMTSSARTSSALTRIYDLAYSHETETALTKYISLNTALGSSYYANWGKSAKVSAWASLGASIKF